MKRTASVAHGLGRVLFGVCCLVRAPIAQRRWCALSIQCLVAGCAWLWGAKIAASAPVDPTVTSVVIGFQGHYKTGRWMPVDIQVTGLSDEATVALTVPDGDGVPLRYTALPPHADPMSALRSGIMLPLAGDDQPAADSGQPPESKVQRADAPAPSRHAFLVRVGQQAGEVQVVVESRDRVLARKAWQIGTSAWPMGRAGGQAIDLYLGLPNDAPKSTAAVRGTTPPLEVRLASLRDLPRQSLAYDSVDAVVLSAGQPMFATDTAEFAEALQALDEWVRGGGRLVFACGRLCESVLGPDSPWSRFVPGRLTGSGTLTKISAVESYAKTSEPLQVDEFYRLPVAQLTDVTGMVEAAEGTGREALPLVVRSPYGFGEVVFVAFDLDDAAIGRWRAKPKLFDRLLGRGGETTPGTPGTSAFGAVNTLGYTDLSGQLRAAIEQFQGVEFISFAFVAALIGLYVLCIGPLDYFLVRRVLRRNELTWITFPAWVAIFCWGAFFLAQRYKGDRLHVNQIDLVDVDLTSHDVRGTTWFNLFSPQTRAYDLALTPCLPAQGATTPEVQLTWLGLPGTGFGGMHQTRAPAAVFSEPYRTNGALSQLEGVPIAEWSTKGLFAHWWQQAESLVHAELEDRGAQSLLGTISSDAEFAFDDVLLLYERWAYPLPALAPGTALVMDRHMSPVPLDGLLRQNNSRQASEKVVPYDPSSTRVPKILEMMMFYEAVGGQAYLRLSNHEHARLDLSHLLRDGRAILLARGSEAAARIECDHEPLAADASRQWTIYRFVLPVRRKADSHD